MIGAAGITILGGAASSGGAAGNSFVTFQTPLGTSPVADSPTDVITFTSNGEIKITGNAVTDTISFDFTTPPIDSLVPQFGISPLTGSGCNGDIVFTSDGGSIEITGKNTPYYGLNFEVAGSFGGNVPIGCILYYQEVISGTPSLPANYAVCNGGFISQGPMYGQTIIDLVSSTYFIRSYSAAGGTGGGNGNHYHGISSLSLSTFNFTPCTVQAEAYTVTPVDVLQSISGISGSSDGNTDNFEVPAPPFYDLVPVMRIS